jgi:hypothetical protein
MNHEIHELLERERPVSREVAEVAKKWLGVSEATDDADDTDGRRICRGLPNLWMNIPG